MCVLCNLYGMFTIQCTAEGELVPTVQCCPTTRELSSTDKWREIDQLQRIIGLAIVPQNTSPLSLLTISKVKL